jgi:hypothetical protein
MDGNGRAVRLLGLAISLVTLLIVAPVMASAHKHSMHDQALIEFARDFSGDDPKVMAKVRGFVATPPTSIEEIGFYGPSDGPAERRQYLATVSALADANHLYASEDKYSNELIHILDRDGKISLAKMPPKAQKFWRAVDENPDDLSKRAFRKLAWETYAEATQAIESELGARGKAIVSIDATDGDTMYFAIVDKTVADRWHHIGLGNFAPYDGGVREPMWDRFWTFLEYAWDPLLVDPAKTGFPPGIRQREADGPLKPYSQR